MKAPRVSLLWRVFAVNAGLLALIALLLIATPVTLHAPPKPVEVAIIVVGLVISVAANALLLWRAFAWVRTLAEDSHWRECRR